MGWARGKTDGMGKAKNTWSPESLHFFWPLSFVQKVTIRYHLNPVGFCQPIWPWRRYGSKEGSTAVGNKLQEGPRVYKMLQVDGSIRWRYRWISMKYIPAIPSERSSPARCFQESTFADSRGLAAACMLLEEALVALGKEQDVETASAWGDDPNYGFYGESRWWTAGFGWFWDVLGPILGQGH